MLMNKLDSQKACALKESNDSYVIYDILKLHPCLFVEPSIELFAKEKIIQCSIKQIYSINNL